MARCEHRGPLGQTDKLIISVSLSWRVAVGEEEEGVNGVRFPRPQVENTILSTLEVCDSEVL